MTTHRRAVITGMGIVSSLGTSLSHVSQALRAAKSGIICDVRRQQEITFFSPLTGHLPDWHVDAVGLSRKTQRAMHEAALYCAAAAKDAIADAQLTEAHLGSWRTGIIIGNDSTIVPSYEALQKVVAAGYTGALGAGAIFQMMNSTASMNLATLFGIRGANWTVSAACASGAHAVGQAAMLIETGMQDVVLCGGTQELDWKGFAAFDALQTFSKRVDDPAAAVRPFDRSRDGLVPSGGAAVLILESHVHAAERGARTYAEIAGYAFSSNGSHLSCPVVEGPAQAMRQALSRAGVRPSDIQYINAHATGTPLGDLHEGRAIIDVFGHDGPPVSSTKSMTGHECWMSGASEVIYVALMMRDGFIAPNRNLEQLDPELTGLNVVRQTTEARIDIALSNSFGFGGTNAALVIKR